MRVMSWLLNFQQHSMKSKKLRGDLNRSISTQGCIWNCVSVIDGYHLQIQTPSRKEVSNVQSFFSGHYQTHGMNIQGACDHHCCFTFLGVAGPGVMGDRDAIKQYGKVGIVG
jgi:hypothetical protein